MQISTFNVPNSKGTSCACRLDFSWFKAWFWNLNRSWKVLLHIKKCDTEWFNTRIKSIGGDKIRRKVYGRWQEEKTRFSLREHSVPHSVTKWSCYVFLVRMLCNEQAVRLNAWSVIFEFKAIFSRQLFISCMSHHIIFIGMHWPDHWWRHKSKKNTSNRSTVSSCMHVIFEMWVNLH